MSKNNSKINYDPLDSINATMPNREMVSEANAKISVDPLAKTIIPTSSAINKQPPIKDSILDPTPAQNDSKISTSSTQPLTSSSNSCTSGASQASSGSLPMCHHCNLSAIDSDDEYCTKCGRELVSQQLKCRGISKKTGRECGFLLLPDCLFCPKCGTHREKLVVKEKKNPTVSLGHRIVAYCTPVESSQGNILPQIYSLPVVQVFADEKSKIRKYEFGTRKSYDFEEKTMLLVGGTGAGKTTLIDALANYVLGVEWEDPFRFTLVQETSGKRNKAISQTDWITAYTINTLEGGRIPYRFTVVDTPGFGDTRGVQKDAELVQQIKALFKTQLPLINAICVVVQAPMVRLTPTLQYIFDSILSVFGNDVKDQLQALITFADDANPPVLSSLSQAQVPCAKYFIFNNSGLFAITLPSNPSTVISHAYWKETNASMHSLFSDLARMSASSLQHSLQVLEERENLELAVTGLHDRVRERLSQVETLRQEKEILKQHQQHLEDNKNFNYSVLETRFRRQFTTEGQFVTNCTVCNITCHKNCAIKKSNDKAKCSAMNRSQPISQRQCTVCPAKCHWNQHANNDFYFELVEQKVERTYEDMLKRYKIAEEEAKDQTKIVKRMKEECERLKDSVLQLVVTIRDKMVRLEEIALRGDPLTAADHLEVLIKAEKLKGGAGFQERVSLLMDLKERAILLDKIQKNKAFPGDCSENEEGISDDGEDFDGNETSDTLDSTTGSET